MKKVLYLIGLVVIATAIVAGGLFLKRNAAADKSLAVLFPENTPVFDDIHEIGQWMPATEGKAAADNAVSERGVDPMLQVLGQVWAAQPNKALPLPVLLAHQPAAAGFWGFNKTKPYFHGAAVIRLAPGQAEHLRKFLEEKLGKGTDAGKAGGTQLHLINKKLKSDGCQLTSLVWGVSEETGIVAVSPSDARLIFEGHGKTLADNPVFKRTVSHFPRTSGSLLFVNLQELRKNYGDFKRLIVKQPKTMTVADTVPAEEGGETLTPGKSVYHTGLMMPEMAKGLKKSLVKLLALDKVESLGLWTLPPAKDGEGWQVKGRLGLIKPATGIWRILISGVQTYQSIDDNIPKNGALYAWSGGKDLSRIYRITMDELGKNLPVEQLGWLRAGIGAVEGKLGISFANDLMPTIGSEACLVITPGEKNKQAGLFFTLRDGRRFEDIVATNLAPQLHLKKTQLKGAQVWSSDFLKDEESRVVLIISGDNAILTNDSTWALSVGGEKSKAFERFKALDTKASGIIVVDPSLWNSTGNTFTSVVWHDTPSGISFESVFPGQVPSWNWKELEKQIKKKGLTVT